MNEELKRIQEHIEEFASYITQESINRIIDSLDLHDTIYSVKVMLRHSYGSSVKDIVLLILRHHLLIGVSIIENRKLMYQKSSMDGLDIKDYYHNIKSTDINCPSKQERIFKNDLLKKNNIPYDNDLTLLDKFNLLEQHMAKLDEKQKIEDEKQEGIKKRREQRKLSKHLLEQIDFINQSTIESDYTWMKQDKPKDKKEAQRRARKRYYEKNKEKCKAEQREYERKKRANKKNDE